MYAPRLAALLLVALPATAQAVLWNIDFGPTQTTFTADLGGGPVSSITAELGGVTYDAPTSGVNAPVYDPITNTIQGQGSAFGFILNTEASAGCDPSTCVLLLQESGNVWNTFNFFQNTILEEGTYSVTPAASVPEPSTAVLMLSALVALFGLRRSRRVRGVRSRFALPTPILRAT